jgi:hypothetical protein
MTQKQITKLEKQILSGPFAEAQQLVNSGNAWLLEGHTGRRCMDAITMGAIMLGDEDHYDYYGNHVPSRHQVKAGTKGSPEFVVEHHDECCLSLSYPTK